LLKQVQEMTRFIVDLQEEEKAKLPDVVDPK